MIDLRVDPFPDDRALGALKRAAWGDTYRGYTGDLKRSLAHVGADARDALVGFVNVAGDGGVHAFILDTSVHPDWRRQGIGLALVRTAAEAARQRGATVLHVDYEERYTAFYAACGFRSTAAGLMRLR